MKIYLKFIKYYLHLLSFIAPRFGGKVATNLFQKVQIKKIKDIETSFYAKTRHFKVSRENAEALHCYEIGNPNGELVFLVHGWNSNAGSLTRFAFALAKKEYRVISLDLPAHANTKETHTNLFTCKNAFKSLIDAINPKQPFSIVAHSFGSAVTAFALPETNYEVKRIVLLSANNQLKDIFLDFKEFIGFNTVIFKQVEFWVKRIMNENLSDMNIVDRLKTCNFEGILVIHDKYDKVIPYKNAEDICKLVNNSVLKTFEKIGHYRMLWNDNVIKETVDFITTKK